MGAVKFNFQGCEKPDVKCHWQDKSWKVPRERRPKPECGPGEKRESNLSRVTEITAGRMRWVSDFTGET